MSILDMLYDDMSMGDRNDFWKEGTEGDNRFIAEEIQAYDGDDILHTSFPDGTQAWICDHAVCQRAYRGKDTAGDRNALYDDGAPYGGWADPYSLSGKWKEDLSDYGDRTGDAQLGDKTAEISVGERTGNSGEG